jgi:hypothetical protein
MKRSIALLGMLSIIVLSAFNLPANASEGLGLGDNTASSSLRRKIDRHVIFPVFQQENMQGTVDVSFQIDLEGHLKIIQINSTNPELIDYVVTKLKKIQLDKEDGNVGQTIKYRFVFKKQA